MTEPPKYQTNATRQPVIGFVRRDDGSVLATGASIEQLRLLLNHYRPGLEIVAFVQPEGAPVDVGALTWRTPRGRLLNEEENQESHRSGILEIRGEGAEAAVTDLANLFSLLLRAELNAPFIE